MSPAEEPNGAAGAKNIVSLIIGSIFSKRTMNEELLSMFYDLFKLFKYI